MTENLPGKLTVARALLNKSPSIFIHFSGVIEYHPSLLLPLHLYGKDQVVLQIGYDMPVPIDDLRINDEGFEGTLSFKGKPTFCKVPWSAVFAIVGDDGKGMVYDKDMPMSIKNQVKVELDQREEKAAKVRASQQSGSNVVDFAAARKRLRK